LTAIVLSDGAIEMRADDFSSDLIRRLRERVAHRCSNPDCRVITTAAGAGEIGVNSIGQAAHIHAASRGAARYKASMSSAQRKAIDNAIWLCASCHAKVDRDEATYTALRLKEWKLSAEDAARSELGQRPITNTDAQNMLIAAFGGAPKHLPRTAVANVIAVGERELQQLDSRFLVCSTYVNKTLTHEIRAVEDVPVSFTLRDGPEGTVFADLRKMFDHGIPVTVPARQAATSGSPLVSHVLDITAAEEGTLTFTPRERPATLKLVLLHPASSQIRTFDDMYGTVNAGRKSISFSGSNCDGVLKISFRKSFSEDEKLADGQFYADLEQWNGCDIRNLAYHEKIDQLFMALEEGWMLEFALEMEGKELLRGRFNDSQTLRPYIAAINTFLAYSVRVRSLAFHLNERIEFQNSISFTREEHKALIDALDVFEHRKVYGRTDMTSNVTCSMVLTDEGAAAVFDEEARPIEVMIRASEREVLKLFEKLVVLPPLGKV
jgi:hypothetical protein